MAKAHLFHTLLALRAAKELTWDILAWGIRREDPFRSTLTCREVTLHVGQGDAEAVSSYFSQMKELSS